MSAKPPDESYLYQAALIHLSRYATTEASLARVLARRIDRWARLEAGADREPEALRAAARDAKTAIPRVVARLKTDKILNDEAFALSRARRLTREGKSRRHALAHLAAKGVAPAAAQAAIADDPALERAAACAYLRRRRAGPFGDADPQKTLAAMARAGFSQPTARQALKLTRDEAEELIKSLHVSPSE